MERFELMYQGYCEALVWVEMPDDRSFQDLGYTIWDFNAEAKADIRADIQRLDRLMAEQNIIIPADAWWQVGADLYFTRQSHGTGFWDRPDIYGKTNAKRLDVLVEQNFSETYARIDDDNHIAVQTYMPRSASCE